MKNNIILIILVFTAVGSLYSQDYIVSEAELVTVFPVGDGIGELGYSTAPDAEINAPTAIYFDSEQKFVVNDFINKRICFFEQDWSLVKCVKLDEYFSGRRMEIDSEGNFISYIGRSGIQKFDKDGHIDFFLYLSGEDIREDIRYDGFYIVDDMVVAHNRNTGELIGFNNLTPDFRENNDKPILNTQEISRALDSSGSSIKIEKKDAAIEMQRTMSSSEPPTRATSQDNGYVLYKDGDLLSRDFDTLQDSRTYQARTLSSTPDDGLLALYNKFKVVDDKEYYGKDNDGNEYWQFRGYLFVLGADGVPIKAIKVQLPRARTSGLALSEDGEIYYMYSTKDGHSLYKYKRVW